MGDAAGPAENFRLSLAIRDGVPGLPESCLRLTVSVELARALEGAVDPVSAVAEYALAARGAGGRSRGSTRRS
ncbi:MAG: hypothetical protein LBQ12_09575 [Deltaproteobacteria bacterium]|nr:hypothetical protein [Deltaproteobacteria bacterium]